MQSNMQGGGVLRLGNAVSLRPEGLAVEKKTTDLRAQHKKLEADWLPPLQEFTEPL